MWQALCSFGGRYGGRCAAIAAMAGGLSRGEREAIGSREDENDLPRVQRQRRGGGRLRTRAAGDLSAAGVLVHGLRVRKALAQLAIVGEAESARTIPAVRGNPVGTLELA